MRLGVLFLKSRAAAPSLACLVGVTAVTWLWARWATHDRAILFLIILVMPLAVATVICVSSTSPFGEAERAAGWWLPTLRLGHLAGQLVLGGGALALVGRDWVLLDADVALVRNVAGLSGLALLAARVVGGGLSWLAPLGYAALALFVGASAQYGYPQWAWALQPGKQEPSRIWAAGLLVAGLLAFVFTGAKESPGELE